MVNIPAAKLRGTMNRKDNIRNMSVIAHLQNGKTTIIDCLVAATRTALDVAGDIRRTDIRADEAERGISVSSTEHGISVSSTGISLLYEMSDESLGRYKGQRDGNEYLINLIDTPGHADFCYQVRAALQITDGALLVVDCTEGCRMQTKALLRLALDERIIPVLTMNKMDRFFIDRKVKGEEVYQALFNIIKDTNEVIATYKENFFDDVRVSPEEGYVAFSAGIHGWAFTIPDMAKKFAHKVLLDESEMRKKLWGDNFFNKKTREWSTERTDTNCERGFIVFCYEPIETIVSLCLNSKKEELWSKLGKLGVTLNNDEKELTGEALIKSVMQKWPPAGPALFDMIVYHLPSPSKAQMYRVDNLYKGPLHDKYAAAIKNCDSKGPLMLYVSKMIPASDKGTFFAFGRVFSGTVTTGMKVRVMCPNDVSGQNYVSSVERTVICLGEEKESVENVPCGNTVALLGGDKYITNNATVTDENEVDACPIKATEFSVNTLVCVNICCKLSDSLELSRGLEYLKKSDPTVVITNLESSRCIIAGASELHTQTLLKDLRDFMGPSKIIEPRLGALFRETVAGKSSDAFIQTFANRFNEIHMKAFPLEEDVLKAIDDGRINPLADLEVRSKILSEDFRWKEDVTKNIWSFGPQTTGSNIVVDMCKERGNEIRDSIVAGFQLACEKGALAEETMRGVHFEVCNVALHDHSNRRGTPHQRIQAAKEAAHGSQRDAKPMLLEPVYRVEIEAPKDVCDAVKAALYRQRGNVFEVIEIQRPGNLLVEIKAYLAVQDSFGFSEALRVVTKDKAIISLIVFDHWEMMSTDPLKNGSMAASCVAEIRRRKGLDQQLAPH